MFNVTRDTMCTLNVRIYYILIDQLGTTRTITILLCVINQIQIEFLIWRFIHDTLL